MDRATIPAVMIAGIQKCSLIDFPGKVGCVLFLTGCNFTCPYCHNPDLAEGRYPQNIGLQQVSAFLKARVKLLDGVVISGGEPCLNARLPELCRLLRSFGYAIKLDTNGSRPEVLADLIGRKLVDYIAMDIKTDPERYGPPFCRAPDCAEIQTSISTIMASGLDYEFRTTCVPPFIDEQIMQRISCAIDGAKRYVLQTFQPHHLLSQEFFGSRPHTFTAEQMGSLREIAAPRVLFCDIR